MSPASRFRSGPAAMATVLVLMAGAACSSGSTPPPAGPRVTPTLSLPTGVTAVTVGGGPVGLALGPDERVWVALADDESVVALTPDGDGYAVGDQVPVGGLPLRVVDQGQDTVTPLATDTGTLGAGVPVGSGPRQVAATGDGVVVTSYQAGTVNAGRRGPDRPDQCSDLPGRAGCRRGRRRPGVRDLHRCR